MFTLLAFYNYRRHDNALKHVMWWLSHLKSCIGKQQGFSTCVYQLNPYPDVVAV